MAKKEFIVGIDFGTTYSGVSWVSVSEDSTSENKKAPKVHVIKDWPDSKAGHANTDLLKFPTAICYEDGAPSTWGSDASLGEKPSLEWFKLLIEPEHGYRFAKVREMASRINEIGKTAEQAMTDFLREMWAHVMWHIGPHMPNDECITKVVLTVPAVWSQVAVERARQAAVSAGIPTDISTVSEPEAGALAVFHDIMEKGGNTPQARALRADDPTHRLIQQLEEGDIFIVCDAGGGTVDLITYKITDLNPLGVREYVKGDGAVCGSFAINDAFNNDVKMRVGEEAFDEVKERGKKRMLHEFDVLKRQFTGPNHEQPLSVTLEGVSANEDLGIRENSVTISSSTLRTMFDHVCNQVVNLVGKQICLVQEKNRNLNLKANVKAVFLIGGFGSSSYLRDRIANSKDITDNNISVIQTDDPWSAVCRGATLWGLENSNTQKQQATPVTVRGRIARYSLGIKLDTTSEGGTKDEMAWLIELGDNITGRRRMERTIEKSVDAGFFSILANVPQTFSHTLWYSYESPPPTRYNSHDMKKLCTISHQIGKGRLFLDTKGVHRPKRVKFTVVVEMGSATLDFFVVYKDKEVKERCRAEYPK